MTLHLTEAPLFHDAARIAGFRRGWKPRPFKSKSRVKSSGQECPLHTSPFHICVSLCSLGRLGGCLYMICGRANLHFDLGGF
jgi:hypothetical protein